MLPHWVFLSPSFFVDALFLSRFTWDFNFTPTSLPLHFTRALLKRYFDLNTGCCCLYLYLRISPIYLFRSKFPSVSRISTNYTSIHIYQRSPLSFFFFCWSSAVFVLFFFLISSFLLFHLSSRLHRRRRRSEVRRLIMTTDPNSFESLKAKLTPQTLQDIEGLDPKKYGFGREECCGPIPAKLPGSMKLKEHIFLNSRMPATQWSKKTENVPGYTELNEKAAAACPNATFTVSHLTADADDSMLHFVLDDAAGGVVITEHSVVEPYELPWKVKGSLAVDRSAEHFIFICAHFTRDSRCGYCGSILVDLFRAAIAETAGAAAKRITVYPCSHVGGHIYAGNVIVYNRHGGVCYGLFKPEDVQTVVDSIVKDDGQVPDSLKPRIRGEMGFENAGKK